MESYHTVAEPAFAEYVEKRSRFLAQTAPVSSPEEAAALLAGARSRYHDADHHCSAWILRAGNAERCSDDGEPHGTAGMPMLEVLRGAGLSDIAVVVTRYFGGTLLGAGGLSRAYSHSTKLVLAQARRIEMARCVVFSLELDYALYGRVEALLSSSGAQLAASGFAQRISLTARLREDSFAGVQRELAERTAGGVALQILRGEFAAFPVE